LLERDAAARRLPQPAPPAPLGIAVTPGTVFAFYRAVHLLPETPAMPVRRTIFSRLTKTRPANSPYRSLFRVSAACIFLAGVMPAAVAVADEPGDVQELRQAVEDLREQVQLLRDDLRRLAAAKSTPGAHDDTDDDASTGSGGGNGASATPGKTGSAQPKRAASRGRPSTPGHRRRVPERPPYYVYPPAGYGWPYYYTPGYVYPYNYHLYYYGVPFNPNSVIVNPYQGLWFSP
jgi:hypothetical protein